MVGTSDSVLLLQCPYMLTDSIMNSIELGGRRKSYSYTLGIMMVLLGD